MLNTTVSPPSATSADREARIQAVLTLLRPAAEQTLRRMAEAVVEAPDAQLFGQLKYDLRDHAHTLARAAHQAGLDGRKKRGT